MTDPRIHERRVLVAREKGRFRRRLLGAGLVLALLVAGGLALVHSSFLGARHVEVSGSAHASHAAVVRRAGLDGSPPLVDLSAPVIARRVETLAWVEKASVSLAWPSTVRIHVTERVPVGYVRAAAGGWAVTDRTGRVLEDVASKPAGLPEISSQLAAPAVGRWLPARLATLAAAAAVMPQSMVSRIVDLQWGPEGIEAALPGKITAVFGNSSLLHDKFVALATVLARMNLSEIVTIDLQVPSSPALLR